MATQSPKAEKAPKSGKKGAKQGKAKASAAGLEAEPKAREGTPRFQTYYLSVVRERLAKEFGLDNPMQVPRLEKMVLNVGLGEAPKNPKQLEAALDDLGRITGHKAVVTRAKKAISNFSLRAGMPIGARVTLRGARMYEFLDRFVTLAVPRLRDFRGLPTKSFDGRGNYSVGIKEQLIFPEVDYDRVEKNHGMDITIDTTADRDDMAMALLREFGWPFRGEIPLRVG